MPTLQKPIEYLKNYIPEHSAVRVLEIINFYRVHLTITRNRKSKYGDYRYAHGNHPHRITVNSSLNKYAFLITLIHELAHLVAFDKYGPGIAAHGKEWKSVYAFLLKDFLKEEIFPADILSVLQASIHNLPASSCSDENLMRILMRYDEKKPGMKRVEELPDGSYFFAEDGKMYQRKNKLRKRIQCIQLSTNRVYLFNPVYEVKVADNK